MPRKPKGSSGKFVELRQSIILLRNFRKQRTSMNEQIRFLEERYQRKRLRAASNEDHKFHAKGPYQIILQFVDVLLTCASPKENGGSGCLQRSRPSELPRHPVGGCHA
ncbi:unnamed protein product [Musa hybrid cultivar]